MNELKEDQVAVHVDEADAVYMKYDLEYLIDAGYAVVIFRGKDGIGYTATTIRQSAEIPELPHKLAATMEAAIASVLEGLKDWS